MNSRERVIATIRHEPRDRIPVFGWVRANMDRQISEAFGSVDAFEDHYQFDLAHLFGGPPVYDPALLQDAAKQLGRPVEPPELLDIPMTDPSGSEAYADVKQQIEHHKTQRGRFVYMQTPGFFEAFNGPFGIENHLMHLLVYPDEIHELYRRQVEWTKDFANVCLDLGVDMVHVSDDWGAQNSLMFSPSVWREMIFPYHKMVTDAVKARGAFVSMHSDGNVMQVLDGIVELGYDVLHPFQESAGMDTGVYLSRYRDSFVLMGGLDVQTTIGFGKLDFLASEIERIIGTFRDGGLILCTSHFVQDHCTVEELVFAYDLIRRLAPE